MEAHVLEGGFADPAIQSAMAFRAVMEAMARPGSLQEVSGAMPPAPLSPAAGAAILVLCDPDTPVHLAGTADCADVRAWIAFHTGAPLVSSADADFAIGTWSDLGDLSAYRIGTPEYPDRSATLIVEMQELTAEGVDLRGPGIRATAALSLPEKAAFQANRKQFPLGLDFIFTCGDALAALPRSTEVI